MGDSTVQVPLPNVSADLIAHLNDALDQVHTASYHLDAHAGEISALLSQASAVTAEVTSSNQGQFVSALQALWSGSHASSGVAADGQHAVALLQTTTSALNTLPPVFAAQMPAITAGMAALAQLQAARPTVCSAQPQQHPQPSLTQDQISDLLGQVNALLAALQAFKGYNLDTLAVRADELRDQMAAVERRMPVDRSAPEWPWLNAQKTLIHKALLGADIRLGTLKLQELEMRSDLFSLLNHGEVDDELIRAMRVRQREIDYYTNAYKRMFKEPPPL